MKYGGPIPVGGVNSAREQDCSVGGGTGKNCLGVVHMEEGVQVRVQVEGGKRTARWSRETHTERVRTKQRGTSAQPLIMDGMRMG